MVGCGWLGAALGLRASFSGWSVEGTTRTPERAAALEARGLGMHLFDLQSDDRLADEVVAGDVLVINIPPGRKDARRRAVYPEWIASLARAAAPHAQLILVSSTSVYPGLNRDVNEDDAAEDAGETASVLLAAEKSVRAERPDAVVLRAGGLYGYDRNPGRFFAGRRDVPGGDAPVNMLHRDDAVRAILRIAERDLRSETLNLCADGHPTRTDFYGVWARRGGYDPPHFLPGGTPWKRVSNARLHDRLGYAFLYPDPLLPAP